MMTRVAPIRGLLLALALAGAPLVATAADPSQISRAENLVFVDRHLANLKPPSALRYEFVKSGAFETAFTDQVRIEVAPTAKGCCAITGSFLSGPRKLALPELDEAMSNPVILYFLEHDIREMARLTQRKSGNYFRNRIRRTMVDEARVRETTVTWQGRALPAQEVVLTPYASDAAKPRYERYASKTYTFVLAPGVPGGVFQLRSVMAGAQPGDPAVMIEEVLSFTDAGPMPAAASR